LIAQFRLGHEHYSRIGERLAALALPAHFVMEGGCAPDASGLNVTSLLSGFGQQAS
jgi:acetoin utilization deacetylase AcuC-like enzyme